MFVLEIGPLVRDRLSRPGQVTLPLTDLPWLL